MPIIDDAALAKGAFSTDDWRRAAADQPLAPGEVAPADRLGEALEVFLRGGEAAGLDLPNDADLSRLVPHLTKIDRISVAFPSFADGRGFSIARRLRDLGFGGRLRARGHVLSDQYAYARAVGFDEIEISEELAARQPIQDWAAAADRPTWFQRRKRA